MLAEISRRKCKPSILPRFLKANPAAALPLDDLLEENEALRKKNAELVSQIARYKALEAELLKWLPPYIR